jgi:hypothetical protein
VVEASEGRRHERVRGWRQCVRGRAARTRLARRARNNAGGGCGMARACAACAGGVRVRQICGASGRGACACGACGAMRRDRVWRVWVSVGALRACAYAFPPRGLLAAFVAKARSDVLRGVIVVPFAPSDPVWPTLAAASCTMMVVGQRDPCVIVPSSRTYVCDGDDLGGAQRLAVMALDLSRWSKRSFAAVVAPCGHHREQAASPAAETRIARRG